MAQTAEQLSKNFIAAIAAMNIPAPYCFDAAILAHQFGTDMYHAGINDTKEIYSRYEPFKVPVFGEVELHANVTPESCNC